MPVFYLFFPFVFLLFLAEFLAWFVLWFAFSVILHSVLLQIRFLRSVYGSLLQIFIASHVQESCNGTGEAYVASFDQVHIVPADTGLGETSGTTFLSDFGS